jgi:hypothetical protein
MGIGMDNPSKKFRYAFVISPGQFDFSPLKPYCDRIIYATDGFGDSLESIREQLEENLIRFDPDKDVIVSTGKSVPSVMTGMIIMRHIMNSGRKNWDSVVFSIYQNGGYVFWRVPLDPDKEIYDITEL